MDWHRTARRTGALIVLLHLAACVRTASTTCEDGTVCAEDAVCVQAAASAAFTCASGAQVAACDGLAEGDACAVPVPGNCYDRVCTPPVCGNARIDQGEVCDDGNTTPGDACSAACASTNTCGNSIVDAEVAEECDSGPAGLGGDGCSSACKVEYRLWRDVEPGIPAARQLQVLAPDPLGDGVILFGGGDLASQNVIGGTTVRQLVSSVFGDTWRWDGSAWRPADGAVRPPPRAAMAAAYDPVRGRIVMFGGFDADAASFDDTWEFNGVRWEQRTTPAGGPSARYGASMACVPQGCVLFGGFAENTPLDDTWLWTGTAWVELVPTARPPARGLAAMATDPSQSRIVMQGGVTYNLLGDVPKVDTWTLVVTGTAAQPSASWQEVDVKSPPPPMLTTTTTIPQLLFDPTSATMLLSANSTLWQLVSDGAGGETWLEGAAAASDIHGLARDPQRGIILALGPIPTQMRELKESVWEVVFAVVGSSINGSTRAAYDARRGVTLVLSTIGTLLWDGRSYRRTADVANSAQPLGVTLAYDDTCDRGVAFGGAESGTAQTATTRLYQPTGTGAPRWEARPASGPPARSGAMLTYDAGRGVTVMYGGERGSLQSTLAFDDLWELPSSDCDAATWILRDVATRPPGRVGGTLTYDPVHAVTVLFGGLVRPLNSNGGSRVADVWQWDGTAWTDVTPPDGALAPTPREGHAAAFDPGYQRVVVSGGRTADGPSDETWAWDVPTRRWQRVVAVVDAPRSAGHALARDVHGLVMLGGSNGGHAWRLTSEQVLDPPERCEAADEDTDGDQLVGCADPDCRSRCEPSCERDDDPLATCPMTGPRCGDSRCDYPREDPVLCPGDCPLPGT